eukprot:CAMPEP_0117430026 /NCGR_PEP_ID=MMETSP0758-20121206/9548_1 /TAXON_ID=63605 /ORGANISM="Percolomonas cosmopolitus, Strain AE-1 (ATCC 50343)" /LENGTH=33 /DNA_ID= /DNA_START= /DNA_END= /DNA_ORIENTATION=
MTLIVVVWKWTFDKMIVVKPLLVDAQKAVVMDL